MRKPRHREVRKKIIVLMGLIALLMFLTIYEFNAEISPNIDAISTLKAQGVINQIISETMRNDFSKKEYETKLFSVKENKDGEIQMVQPNTKVINGVIAEFSYDLQKNYDAIKEKTITISSGSLFGSKLLSQTDWKIGIKIMPMSVSKCDFETEFVTKGINQTKYKVYIIIESNVRILQPFSSTNLKIRNKMLLAEVVIVGEVPNSYVMVPKDDVLDVTDE